MNNVSQVQQVVFQSILKFSNPLPSQAFFSYHSNLTSITVLLLE